MRNWLDIEFPKFIPDPHEIKFHTGFLYAIPVIKPDFITRPCLTEYSPYSRKKLNWLRLWMAIKFFSYNVPFEDKELQSILTILKAYK